MKFLCFVLAIAPCAFSQNLPQFEVASLKASAPGSDYSVNIGVHIDGAQVSSNNQSLVDLIRLAYDVKQYQVTAPEWMATTRFDLKARIPEGGKPDQIRDMVKSLLAERFHLKFHRESKEFPVYALVVEKDGAKLKESTPLEGDDEKGANVTASGGPQGITVNLGHGAYFSFADNKLEAKRLDTTRFCEMLARFTDRPVVDMTGLKGIYDFDLKVTEEDYNAMRIRAAIAAGVVLPPQAMRLLELSSGDSLASSMKALGLKLDPRKAPIEVLVIDSADKTPTEN